MFESIQKNPNPTEILAKSFNDLISHQSQEGFENKAFDELERTLFENGLSIAGAIEVAEVLRSEKLFCRSEQFSRVIDLITLEKDLEITNTRNQANMCTVSAGSGFRTAMLEGFSGKDVGGTVKVVVTFQGNHLVGTSSIPKDNDLWKTKPETAAVSVAGSGQVTKDDIEMISFRFPTKYFPESKLTEDEQDRLEEEGVGFIVRHYVPNKNAAPSNVS
jgi:hypothetical protein